MKTELRFLLCLALIVVLQSCTPKSRDDAPSVSSVGANPQLFQMSNITGRTFGLKGTKQVLLTFDDGPNPGVTENILDYLRSENIRAGFFLVGKRIDGNEAILQRMADEGHTIGNHTWDHSNLVRVGRLGMENVYEEIAKTDAKIAPFVRANSHFYFRAPGGSFNDRGSKDASIAMNIYPDLAKYIGPIYWDIGGQIDYANEDGTPSTGNLPTEYITAAADWDCWKKDFPVETCAAAYIRETVKRQGGVVLMHDHSDLVEHEDRTYQMIQIVIPELKKQGYTFITLDDVPGIDQMRSALVH